MNGVTVYLVIALPPLLGRRRPAHRRRPVARRRRHPGRRARAPTAAVSDTSSRYIQVSSGGLDCVLVHVEPEHDVLARVRRHVEGDLGPGLRVRVALEDAGQRLPGRAADLGLLPVVTCSRCPSRSRLSWPAGTRRSASWCPTRGSRPSGTRCCRRRARCAGWTVAEQGGAAAGVDLGAAGGRRDRAAGRPPGQAALEAAVVDVQRCSPTVSPRWTARTPGPCRPGWTR